MGEPSNQRLVAELGIEAVPTEAEEPETAQNHYIRACATQGNLVQ